MEGFYGPDGRGLYVDPNFSFEETFCREITSSLGYEDDRGNSRVHERVSELAGVMAQNAAGFYSSAISTGRFDENIPNLSCMQNSMEENCLGLSRHTQDDRSTEFEEGFAFESSPCENDDPEIESPTGTWSAEEDSNNGIPSPRVKGEPMKRIRRLRANDRERRRMRSLNRALDSLKKCIPVPQSKRRVTKLEILRIACNYIKSLSDTLRGDSSGAGSVFRKRNRTDAVVNGFSVAQRLEILSGSGTHKI